MSKKQVVVKFGITSALGAEGRRFKSCQPEFFWEYDWADKGACLENRCMLIIPWVQIPLFPSMKMRILLTNYRNHVVGFLIFFSLLNIFFLFYISFIFVSPVTPEVVIAYELLATPGTEKPIIETISEPDVTPAQVWVDKPPTYEDAFKILMVILICVKIFG